MPRIAGITIEKDLKGRDKYVRINLNKHGDNELLEDFLDLKDVEARENEETTPWTEFIEKEKKRRKH